MGVTLPPKLVAVGIKLFLEFLVFWTAIAHSFAKVFGNGLDHSMEFVRGMV